MGINGLWELVRDSAERCPLAMLVARDGMSSERDHPYRIGVDASIWFKLCQRKFTHDHAKHGENPELRTLFYKFAQLLSLPVAVVFVFDGPERPEFKRGTKVIDSEHWMVQHMKDMAEGFGFEWSQARGEAEAELATMNRIGIIDAVLTDDSDTFVFGAKVVIRNPNKAADKGWVTVFTSNAIRSKPTVAMNKGAMLLVALLVGGDYDATGLAGCGPTTAHGLARYDLGNTLYNAAIKLDDDKLVTFLDGWRAALRDTLRRDPDGLIGQRHPVLARDVPNTFPSIAVVRAYTDPVTSDTGGVPPQPREPDLGKLAKLCEILFSWGTEEGILQKFRSLIWPGVVMRRLMLLRLHSQTDGIAAEIHIGNSRVTDGLHQHKITIDTASLVRETVQSLRKLRKPLPRPSTSRGRHANDAPLKFHVPACVMPLPPAALQRRADRLAQRAGVTQPLSVHPRLREVIDLTQDD